MNEPSEIITKPELLSRIHTERNRLEEMIASLTPAQMLVPGVDGEWTVKDVLAHISAWERWMIRWTNNLLQDEKPETPELWDVERMNEEIYARVKNIPFAEVLEEFSLSYRDSLTLIENLSEDQLQAIYLDTWPLGPLWERIIDNTASHYSDHCRDIQKWLETLRKET
jgi:hypothetical protein